MSTRGVLSLGVAAALVLPVQSLSTATNTGAAPSRAVSVEPSSGRSDQGDIRLITEQPCPPRSTNVVVQAVGGSFPPGSNALGNSELAEMPAPVIGDGLTLPLFGSWDVIAQSNGAGPLAGVVELVVVCFEQGVTERLAEMHGRIRFTPLGGKVASYEQVGGPELYSGLSTAPGTEKGQELARAAGVLTPATGRGAQANTPAAPAAPAASGLATDDSPGPGPAPQVTGEAGAFGESAVAGASREGRGGPGFPLILLGGLLAAGTFLVARARRITP